jgi:hypothetical protein
MDLKLEPGRELRCFDLAAGWQKTRADAKRQGEGALFRLFASCRKNPSIGYGIRRGH